MAPNRRIAVIYNPAAGQRTRRRYTAVMKVLGERGAAVTELRTAGAGGAERLATGVRAGGRFGTLRPDVTLGRIEARFQHQRVKENER